MNDSCPEGGSAFPNSYSRDNRGMYLRDYFAAKAMQSIIRHYSRIDPGEERKIAKLSFDLADAMIEEGQKKWRE